MTHFPIPAPQPPEGRGIAPAGLKTAGFSKPDLSPLELHVISKLLDFRSQKAIAVELRLAPATIHNVVMSARKKFNALSTGELLRRCRLMGL